jgi:hypothetical protein
MSNQEVPEEILSAAQDALFARQQAMLSAIQNLSKTLRRLRAESINETHILLGPKLQNYNTFRQQLKDRFTLIRRDCVHTQEGLKTKAEERLKLLRQAREYLRKSGVDIARIQEIKNNYKAKAQEAVAKILEIDEKAPTIITDPALVPKPTHNPWTWKYPGYNGEWGTTWFDQSKGAKLISHKENSWSGEIGCHSRVAIYDASDDDYCWTKAMSEVWLWFKTPAAGMIEAWVDLQTIYANYDGWLEDEWGFSDADIRQQSWAYLEIISPAGKRRENVFLDYRRGEDEGDWNGSPASAGSHRWAHLYSMESYPAGKWVLIAIGVLDFNFVWVNDMSCEAWLTNRYFIPQLILRSTGAP